MKFVILSLALVACALADVSELGGGYDYAAPSAAVISQVASAPSASAPSNSYIPPAASAPAPVNAYIPPAASAPAPVNTYIPPATGSAAASAPIEVATDFGDDGYRYKTVRRRVIRRRL